MATGIPLLAAGHETTANVIANSTLALLDNFDRAVGELLRLHNPAKLTGRTALVDHHLGGQYITAGQAVLIGIQQANRDHCGTPHPL